VGDEAAAVKAAPVKRWFNPSRAGVDISAESCWLSAWWNGHPNKPVCHNRWLLRCCVASSMVWYGSCTCWSTACWLTSHQAC